MRNLAKATKNGTTLFTVTPGVYRLTDDPGPLVIENTQNFVFSAAGVEIIAELDNNSFRLLGNINLTIQGTCDTPTTHAFVRWQQGPTAIPGAEHGMRCLPAICILRTDTSCWQVGSQDAPLIMDADPLPWSQGVLTGYNNDSNTIDFRPMDGYQTVESGGSAGRIELFTPDGVCCQRKACHQRGS